MIAVNISIMMGMVISKIGEYLHLYHLKIYQKNISPNFKEVKIKWIEDFHLKMFI